MQRLARGILIAVAVFVLVVAAILVSRTRSGRGEAIAPNRTNADLRVKEMDIKEESGKVHWHLLAEQALVFESEGRTSLKRVNVRVEEPDRWWTVVGDEGDLFQQKNDLEVRRNVVMTASDGMVLETTVLRWDNGKKRLWTDVPVKITRDNAVIHGRAIDIDMSQEATTVAGRVNAVFTRASAAATPPAAPGAPVPTPAAAVSR